MSNSSCPVCAAPDRFIAAPRHVASWGALSAEEQQALLARLGEAFATGAQGIALSSLHGHLHLLPLQADRLHDPDVALTTGGTDPLLPLLSRAIDRATAVDIAVAFAMDSGVRLLEPWLQDLLARGGRLRMVVGDYMDVTEPAALRRLCDLEGADLRVFETGRGSFHPKAWLFRATDRAGYAIVGSSNLSATALTHGVEWNLQTQAGGEKVALAFEALLQQPQVKPLAQGWIDAYAARRRAMPLPEFAQRVVSDEPPAPPPAPHPIQQAALGALAAARARGQAAGLVILATGLGKTWLAAFDSLAFGRVLFVAHRQEILAQAMQAFRRIRPEARFGRYDGLEKDEQADILFASVQTLGQGAHLRRFAPDRFDYIIIDEFHHASAPVYRALIAHFTPAYRLGLTATPDRSDGADLLALCDDNLVYQCDLFAGIEAGYLSPFRYVGVPDAVDYAQIPWRSARFDPAALEAALATEARAANALEQFRKHAHGPAIGFCCSTRHADFMTAYFRRHGLRAVAVHSGPLSAPRTSSLESLGKGEIDILFAVDMFNEGVDVPQIGTVMMLRPTESVIIWLQQLGRGLRRVEGKLLRVIDYIGNHRIFLTKLRALLQAGGGDRSLLQRLEAATGGELALPPGCSVTYELEVVEILRDLLRPREATDELEAQYRDFRLRHGLRPTAAEIAAMGFDPGRTGHGGWFDFVRDMADPVDEPMLEAHRPLLRRLEREALPREALAGLRAILRQRPVSETQKAPWALSPALREVDGRLRLRREDPQGAGLAMLEELIDWRLQGAVPAPAGLAEPAQGFARGAVLWREYMREAIPPLFGEAFNSQKWGVGIVRTEGHLFLLTTLKKTGMSMGSTYKDRFLSPDMMQWESQTQTKRDGLIGRILQGVEPGYRVHLFVRNTKLRNGKAAPFLYCGEPAFVDWTGDAPITIRWKLPEPVPAHLYAAMGGGRG